MRFVSALVISLFTLHAHAAMVRVVAVENGRTLVIDRNGTRETIRLAGVALTDDVRARELLRWTAVDAWVMLEPAEGGEFLVYRSPDALFLNRELVLRGFAQATAHGIEPELRAPSRYLGEINPPAMQQPQRRAVSEPKPRTGSGTGRRSSAPRSRSSRSPASRK